MRRKSKRDPRIPPRLEEGTAAVAQTMRRALAPCRMYVPRFARAVHSRTHLAMDHSLSGRPLELRPGFALVELQTTSRMSADEHGLTHGGFYFSMADYAAMLAVNDPHVVLGAAECRFLKPVRCDDVLQAAATVTAEKGKKRTVEVTVARGSEEVFQGTFVAFVLDHHVLETDPD